MSTTEYRRGDRVNVVFSPCGCTAQEDFFLPGTVERTSDTYGVKVRFDEPEVYGGFGFGWFGSEVVE